MAKKANPTLIGVFVLGAAALAVASVAYFGSGNFGRRAEKYVLFFDGSLQGLTVGAPVQFRGVRIGSVVDIFIRYHADDQHVDTPVYVEIEADRVEWVQGQPQKGEVLPQMIERGLRAQLVTQSFVTGMLAVQLDFHPGKPAIINGADKRYLEIPTIPSTLEEITRTLQNLPLEEMMNDLRHAVQGLDEIVRSPALSAAISSFQSAAADIGILAQNINQQVAPVAGSLMDTATDIRSTLAQAGARISAAETSLSETLLEYKKLAENANGQIEPLATSLKSAAGEAQSALRQSRQTIEELQRVVARDSELHYNLMSALTELATAARSVQMLADSLERNPESLLRGKPGDGVRE